MKIEYDDIANQYERNRRIIRARLGGKMTGWTGAFSLRIVQGGAKPDRNVMRYFLRQSGNLAGAPCAFRGNAFLRQGFGAQFSPPAKTGGR